jgi:hypothetical protein
MGARMIRKCQIRYRLFTPNLRVRLEQEKMPEGDPAKRRTPPRNLSRSMRYLWLPRWCATVPSGLFGAFLRARIRREVSAVGVSNEEGSGLLTNLASVLCHGYADP